MKWLVNVVLVVAACAALTHAKAVRYRLRRSTSNEYKMCVPDHLLEPCREMSSQETKSSAKIVCIPARDRYECIQKIRQRLADFGMVDPEDMYLAAEEGDFAVFEEIRTVEEPEAEFRYEAVAVIHKDLAIDSVEGLRGLASCHTGIGRNVGYKIPITKLKQKGLIGNLNDPDLSPRENELSALSNLFSKACIVGTWSPDPKINKEWKTRYANLCALCENPEKCDYPDKYSGYDGALRCLAKNGGQVAWTKVVVVKKFFGLPVGNSPATTAEENPDDFAYFCPDGTKAPITGPPCKWAARPWQGYMANADVVKTFEDLRKKIENLNTIGTENHADWLEKVLELDEKHIPEETKVISPKDYLDKANYTDVIERDYGPPFKTVRFCVTSDEELGKCRDLSKAAFSREIRPRYDCVLEKSVDTCMESIRDDAADIITLDGGLVDIAVKKYNLKPIVAEQYGKTGGAYYTVAVVKKDSSYQSFEDLKGAKSCHTGIDRTAGYNAPLYTLLKKDLIKKDDCPYPKALSEYFSGGSCLPGAKKSRYSLEDSTVEKLCSLCVGDTDKNDASSRCNGDSSEAYNGYTGAFRCLVQGGGDVAFVKHVTVPGNTDGKNPEAWAANLKSSDYELLCPDGGRVPVDQYEKCYLVHAPPHMVVTSNSKSNNEIEIIQNALISTSTLYTENPDLFKLFGPYNGKQDLLFKDSATGLVSVPEESEIQKEYSTILDYINGCQS